MESKSFRTFLFTLFFILPAFGGTEGKGGGKGVFCPLQDGTRVLLTLDYDRAVYEWSIPPRFTHGATATEKAVNMVRRLALLDPIRATRYETMVQSFESSVDWQSGRKFRIVDDSLEIGYCAGGSLEQIVVQAAIPMTSARSPLSEFAPWLFMGNKDLKVQLDADQLAGLIVHEVILRDLKLHGVEFSDNASKFNALIASNKIAEYSPFDYAVLLVKLGLMHTKEAVYSRLSGVEGRDTLALVLEERRKTGKRFPESEFNRMLFVAISQNEMIGHRHSERRFEGHFWGFPNSLGTMNIRRGLRERVKALARSGIGPDQYLILQLGEGSYPHPNVAFTLVNFKVVPWNTPFAWLDTLTR